ncbi:hypothetical protein RhiXN_08933 [Rhizoctonia solani]|uniref:Uncharacterized protein n=1 Tax=Rhizoctonia solani TaxID=456999 RepID=A0A8H8NX59_9AGAM|nr:uncharacterized protein RhiXN_08933 [Rhizoctonia solani]QRW19958.1 hypothetical protein RhiXN_08933 [Rhizoctonia solani]
MIRLREICNATPTATTTAGSDADGPVVTDAPRLVPLDLEMQRRRRRTVKRQNFPDSCGNVGNDVLSCYPTEGMTVVQGSWTRFGTLDPEYIGYGNLDIYLFHADSRVEAFKWSNVPNDSNWVGVSVNDSFWGTRGVTGWRDGQNQSMPFYFVATDAGAALDGGEPRQATFTASELSRKWPLLSSSFSESSPLPPSCSWHGSPHATSAPANDAGSLPALPHPSWVSPPPRPHPNPPSPHRTSPASIVGRPVSIRRGGSLSTPTSTTVHPPVPAKQGPSGQDAAIMASAFRAMLRKPDFASRPEEEDESPEERNVRDMKEQLAEEGRDIQSVRSERGVRVHNTAEDGSEDGWGRPTTPRR